MSREVFLGQLEYIGQLQRDADRLATKISELPSPWPGMAEARNKSAQAVTLAFDQLVAYQRILINKVGPKDEVLGELSSKVMEAIEPTKRPTKARKKS